MAFTVFMNWFSSICHQFALYFIKTFRRFCTDWFTVSFVSVVGNRIECLRNLIKTSCGYSCVHMKTCQQFNLFSSRYTKNVTTFELNVTKLILIRLL